MGKIVGFIIDIILALVIIFFAVTIYFGLRMESVMKSLGTEVSDDFMDHIDKNGYFTLADYEAFIQRISLTDVLYDVSFQHEYHTHEPEYRFRTLQEIIDEQNRTYTGTNYYTYIPVSTTVPTVSDPVNNGSLNTETNASVLASAVSTPSLPDHIHTDACYIGHRHTDSCILESYYTSSLPNRVTMRTSTSSYMGISYTDYYFTCNDCGSSIFHVSKSDASISSPYGYAVGIQSTQVVLGKDLMIKDKDVYWVTKYLVSNTDPNDSSWYHFRDTITVNGYPQFIENWRKDRGDWYYNYERLLTFDNYLAAPSGVFISLNDLYRWGFKAKYGCPGCMLQNIKAKTLVDEASCGQSQDETMDCSSIVTSITATHPVQTVATNDPLIATVRATYLDGSTKVVLATSSFSTANVVQNQTATLTYTYVLSGVSYTKTCNITVTVIPRSKSCINGHTYHLNGDGSDQGCPYCRAWVASLSFVYPTTTPFVINIGTTLQDNGVRVLVTYMDGHTETLTSGYADNLDKRYLGTQQVTIGYKGVATYLMVKTICVKVTCSICGYIYDLYPDGTDPGCPRCIEKIPIFTGNILSYDNTEYTEHILEKLYQEGIYEFNQEDKFVVKIINKTSNIGRKLLNVVFPSLTERWFSYVNEETIKAN